MNFGLIVEGNRDAAAYPELIKKIRGDATFASPIPCGGVDSLEQQFVDYLRGFQWGAWPHVDKVLVIRDSDCKDPITREGEMNDILKKSHFAPTLFPVHFHATKCELECWLLADENAINQVARERSTGKPVPRVNEQLESLNDAKALFRSVLSKAGLPASPEVYKEIAAAADIGRIAARCPDFKRFREKVNAC